MINKRLIIENYVISNKESLYRIAFAYAKNREDALDIVQDSILKAFKSSHNLKSPEAIKTWYYRILTHTAIDFMRKNKKYVLSDDNFISDDKGEFDNYENIDLKKALNMLTAEQRIIITLRFFEDLKLKEIAEITGENLSTIKSRLYKALKALKINIGDDYKYE